MHDELSPTCGRVQNELSAFLYGELAPDSRAALEQHVEGCVPCREELAALRETRRLLSRWETPAASDDPRELAREIAALAGGARDGLQPLARPRLLEKSAAKRGRLVRWSALVSGAAAAVVFSLSVLNASVSYEGGHFRLDFALPGSRASALGSAQSETVMSETVRELVAREVAARSAALEQEQHEFFQRCAQMNQQELLRMAQAVDNARAQDQRTIDNRLEVLGRNDLETRQVLTNLASYLPDPNR